MNHLVPASTDALEPIQPIAPFIQAKRSPKTRWAYRLDLELFINEVGFQNPLELLQTKPEQVAAYRDKLIEEGQSPATIARKLSTLRTFFSYCIKRGWLNGTNPADAQLVKVPFVSQEITTNGLELKEARLLLDSPKQEFLKGKRDRAILALMRYHGFRREVLVKLRTSSLRDEFAVPSQEGIWSDYGGQFQQCLFTKSMCFHCQQTMLIVCEQ